MKDLLKSIKESKNMPQYITVQVPLNDQPRIVSSPKAFKTARVETRPEFTWEQMYPFNYHDELNWQRRITGNDKLTHEEGNYIHFLVSDDGKTWRVYALYNISEEVLYCDNIRECEKCAGVNFSVSMTSSTKIPFPAK